jgi:hypothetical protein
LVFGGTSFDPLDVVVVVVVLDDYDPVQTSMPEIDRYVD